MIIISVTLKTLVWDFLFNFIEFSCSFNKITRKIPTSCCTRKFFSAETTYYHISNDKTFVTYVAFITNLTIFWYGRYLETHHLILMNDSIKLFLVFFPTYIFRKCYYYVQIFYNLNKQTKRETRKDDDKHITALESFPNIFPISQRIAKHEITQVKTQKMIDPSLLLSE